MWEIRIEKEPSLGAKPWRVRVKMGEHGVALDDFHTKAQARRATIAEEKAGWPAIRRWLVGEKERGESWAVVALSKMG